jgi:NhaP-type Na+/H+ or K+/H+ antiporter
LTVLLLLLFGGAVVGGLLASLTWRAAVAGVALVFLVRPLIAWLALRGAPGTRAEHAVIAFFGIRGIGSFYYLAYATAAVTFPQAGELWALIGFVVIVSVVVHGVSATPVMRRLDRRHERSNQARR